MPSTTTYLDSSSMLTASMMYSSHIPYDFGAHYGYLPHSITANIPPASTSNQYHSSYDDQCFAPYAFLPDSAQEPGVSLGGTFNSPAIAQPPLPTADLDANEHASSLGFSYQLNPSHPFFTESRATIGDVPHEGEPPQQSHDVATYEIFNTDNHNQEAGLNQPQDTDHHIANLLQHTPVSSIGATLDVTSPELPHISPASLDQNHVLPISIQGRSALHSKSESKSALTSTTSARTLTLRRRRALNSMRGHQSGRGMPPPHPHHGGHPGSSTIPPYPGTTYSVQDPHHHGQPTTRPPTIVPLNSDTRESKRRRVDGGPAYGYAQSQQTPPGAHWPHNASGQVQPVPGHSPTWGRGGPTRHYHPSQSTAMFPVGPSSHTAPPLESPQSSQPYYAQPSQPMQQPWMASGSDQPYYPAGPPADPYMVAGQGARMREPGYSPPSEGQFASARTPGASPSSGTPSVPGKLTPPVVPSSQHHVGPQGHLPMVPPLPSGGAVSPIVKHSRPPMMAQISTRARSMSRPSPPPDMGVMEQVLDSNMRSLDEDVPFEHGPSQFPPRPYPGGDNAISPFALVKKQYKLFGSRLEQMPPLEKRVRELEVNLDRYLDYRSEQAIRNSQLPGADFSNPPIRPPEPKPSNLFSGVVYQSALARRVKREKKESAPPPPPGRSTRRG